MGDLYQPGSAASCDISIHPALITMVSHMTPRSLPLREEWGCVPHLEPQGGEDLTPHILIGSTGSGRKSGAEDTGTQDNQWEEGQLAL